MVRTLLLDLDGTLVDSVPDLAAAVNRLMRSRGLPEFSNQDVAAMVGDGIAILTSRAFAAHNLQPDANAVDDLASDYAIHVAVHSRLYPGVPDTLAGLVGQGWRLAICTNKPEPAARKLLEAVGLISLFAAIGGGDSFPVRKPDPGHLLATLASAGGQPDSCLILGDHRNDVMAAAGAGVPSIFAAWGYGSLDMAAGSAGIAHNIQEAAAIANRLLPLRD